MEALTRSVSVPEPRRFSLRFPDTALEREFLLWFGRKAQGHYRVVVPFVLAIWLAFGLLDHRVQSGDDLFAARVMRFGIATPVLLAGIALGYAPARVFARYWQYLLCVAFVILLGVILVMTMHTRGSTLQHSPTAISLVLVGGYTLVMMRFVYAAAVGLLGSAVAAGIYIDIYGTKPVVYDSLNTGVVWIVLANGIGMFACHQLERFRREHFVQQLQIEREGERVEALLHNILPASIAHRLKEGGTPPVDAYDSVTVLFGDLVGFTALAEKLPPRELVRRLGELFTEFDAIAERHGLEKIKTIGDGYMLVGGLPEPRDDHARAVADMALDMLDVIDRRRERTGEPLDIRIGIHTGPVVAGVIGTKKFSYDVWGDTVNTASRMQSHGVAGAVHASATTYEALREHPRYALESRGSMEVKGKGAMTTYLLRRASAPAATPAAVAASTRSR